jgi:pyrroline-5-carboxylate reductase
MQVGLIGAGNMAAALARGWGDPVLCSDSGSGRARALAQELGGEAFDSNAEVAKRADLVVLCHKPYQLHAVAQEIRDHALEAEVIALFERVGTVIKLPEPLIEVGAAVMSVGPAYQALLAEAQVDAAIRQGLSAPLASHLVVETMAGTAALLAARDYDTLGVRREVTSPAGSTARGLAALERAGVRSAFNDAIDAVTDWSKPK